MRISAIEPALVMSAAHMRQTTNTRSSAAVAAVEAAIGVVVGLVTATIPYLGNISRTFGIRICGSPKVLTAFHRIAVNRGVGIPAREPSLRTIARATVACNTCAFAAVAAIKAAGGCINRNVTHSVRYQGDIPLAMLVVVVASVEEAALVSEACAE